MSGSLRREGTVPPGIEEDLAALVRQRILVEGRGRFQFGHELLREQAAYIVEPAS